MKRLPESELEIMMIIWRHGGPINRMEIEDRLEKKVAAPTILSFLNRLEAKGFVSVEKIGKVNWYTPLVKEEAYLQRESKNILRKLYRNSLKNFVAALYDGDALTQQDMDDLAEFLEKKGRKTRITQTPQTEEPGKAQQGEEVSAADRETGKREDGKYRSEI